MSEIIKLICLVRNDIERQDFLACFAAKANKFYIYQKCSDSVLILLCQSPNQFQNFLKRVETNVPIVFSDVSRSILLVLPFLDFDLHEPGISKALVSRSMT